MSTNNQNVNRKPPRATTNIKVSEKSKIKTDDNKKPTAKKDQPEKTTTQSKLEKEKIVKSQAKSNLNISKTKLASKYVSSPSNSGRSSKTSSTESTKLKAEVKKLNTSQPTIITNKSQTTNKLTTKKQSTPTSSRVSSTKFFPSKQIFTEAIRNSLSEEAAKKLERNDKSKSKMFDEATSNEASKIKDIPANKNKEKSNLQIENTTRNRERNKTRVLSPSAASKIKDVPASDKTKNKEKSNSQAEDITKNRERNKTRVLSPSEVKVLKQETSLDSNYDERPRTATIKKSQPTQEANDNSYEDDFDSYESDFEAYTSSDVSSTANDMSSDESSANSESINSVDSPRQSKFTESEEDRKLDSGNYDLPENKHKQVLDNIKEFVEPVVLEQNRSNLASLSDEGFEEGKSLDRAVNQFVNFVDAQKKHNHLRSLQKKRKRGEEILSMIRLDNQAFFLFEIPAIPYEVFIQKYGNNNAIQVAVQTGDDVLMEESQTDRIDYSNKWTQFPVSFSNYDQSDSNFMIKYKMECLGVGADSTNEEAVQHVMQEYNEVKLNEFLLVVGDVVMTLLEEKYQKISKDIEANSGIVPFSDGYIQFNTNIQMLQEHKVIFISFSTCGAKFLSIHTNHNSEADLETIVCVWKISNPNEPELVLTAYGQVTCCCFDDNINLIYGGLSNGTIAVWDLNANRNLLEQNTKNSFMTNISSGHTSMIVSIVSAVDEEDLLNRNRIRQNCNSQQIYTLDEDGNLMIWSVIILQQSHRKAISLVMNSKLSFSEEYPQLTNLRCTHMSVNLLDTNHIFVSTNYGMILHFITSGARPIPKKYGALQSQVNCISPCPFSPFYFLSGCQNGSIMLYSRNMEKPLMTMSNGEDYRDSEIEFIEWSYSRPCIFYTKDSKNNLHVWDLTMSDIFPTYTIPFKEKVNFIKLSPMISKDISNTKSYLIIVTNDCTIKLHILNKEHRQQTQIEYEENVKKFLNYVNRL